MGATQSIAGAPLGGRRDTSNATPALPSAAAETSRGGGSKAPVKLVASGNNGATVKALLMARLTQGEEPVLAVHPYYQPWQRANPASLAPSTSSESRPPPQCPMHSSSSSSSSSSSRNSSRSGDDTRSESSSKLNPFNMLPSLTQDRAKDQKTALSTERVRSTIPRSRDSATPGASPYDKPEASACPVPHAQTSSSPNEQANKSDGNDESKWEYPSPQQFYNALVRKGWETPEEHVEMMVLCHNFLNERAWNEVLDWERDMGVDPKSISLARFQGRPGTISPKARLFSWAAMIAPSKFSSEAPFDRHDWIVRRPSASQKATERARAQSEAATGTPIPPSVATTGEENQGKEVRYVIDYYSGPDDPDTDEPVFFLDVRPALDSPEAAWARLKRTWDEWSSGEEASASKAHSPSS